MIKQDELDLMRAVLREGLRAWWPPDDFERSTPLDLGRQIGIHDRRIEYLTQKWVDRGWMECGVSSRTGWLTRAGEDHFEKVTTASA